MVQLVLVPIFTVTKVLMVALIGGYCATFFTYPQFSSAGISTMRVKIFLPAMLCATLAADVSMQELQDGYGWAMILCLLPLVLGHCLGRYFSRFISETEFHGLFLLSTTFQNCVSHGMGITQAVGGFKWINAAAKKEFPRVVFMWNLPHSLAVWSGGTWMVRRGKQNEGKTHYERDLKLYEAEVERRSVRRHQRRIERCARYSHAALVGAGWRRTEAALFRDGGGKQQPIVPLHALCHESPRHDKQCDAPIPPAAVALADSCCYPHRTSTGLLLGEGEKSLRSATQCPSSSLLLIPSETNDEVRIHSQLAISPDYAAAVSLNLMGGCDNNLAKSSSAVEVVVGSPLQETGAMDALRETMPMAVAMVPPTLAPTQPPLLSESVVGREERTVINTTTSNNDAVSCLLERQHTGVIVVTRDAEGLLTANVVDGSSPVGQQVLDATVRRGLLKREARARRQRVMGLSPHDDRRVMAKDGTRSQFAHGSHHGGHALYESTDTEDGDHDFKPPTKPPIIPCKEGMEAVKEFLVETFTNITILASFVGLAFGLIGPLIYVRKETIIGDITFGGLASIGAANLPLTLLQLGTNLMSAQKDPQRRKRTVETRSIDPQTGKIVVHRTEEFLPPGNFVVEFFRNMEIPFIFVALVALIRLVLVPAIFLGAFMLLKRAGDIPILGALPTSKAFQLTVLIESCGPTDINCSSLCAIFNYKVVSYSQALLCIYILSIFTTAAWLSCFLYMLGEEPTGDLVFNF